MEFISKRERLIRESVESMFRGLDGDELLKNIILYNALGKSEEEKAAMLEAWKRKQEEDAEYLAHFEITDVAETVPEVFMPSELEYSAMSKSAVESMTPALDVSIAEDILDNADGRCWQFDKADKMLALEHPDNGEHSAERKHEE